MLSADFQTKQLGEDMLHYRLTVEGELVAPCGAVLALVKPLRRKRRRVHRVFTHGRLEFLNPLPKRWATVTAAWGEGFSGCGIPGDLTHNCPTVRACQRAGPAGAVPHHSRLQGGRGKGGASPRGQRVSTGQAQ